MAFDYPVILDLADIPVLVVGGGHVALRKIEGLLRAGAQVRVVAPEVDDAITELPVHVEPRPFEATDLHDVRLVFTATDDPTTNADVAAEAARHGIWVNAADDPRNCTFTLPAVARQGAVTVAVSTGGATPALSSHLRNEIQLWLADIGAAEAAAELAAQRAELHERGLSTETLDWSERVRAALRTG